MVLATELRAGMAIRIEQQVYKILETEAKSGAAKMGGLVRVKLRNIRSGRMWEHHLRPQERLEDVELERHMMEFLYSDDESCTLMRADTFEQVSVPVSALGDAEKFLEPGAQVPVEFFDGEPVDVTLPSIVEARIATTAPPSRSTQDSAWKEAVLENGVAIRVPLFVGPGETVRVDLKSGHYIDRVRERKSGT